MIEIAVNCIGCDKLVKFEVDEQGLIDWQNGALVQHAFPELESSLREMLLTKLCPACSDKLFSWGDE
jgi:hypothetical protein